MKPADLLRSTTGRALFLAITIALTTTYIWLAAREARADAWGHSVDLAGIRQSVELQPHNSDTLLLLGRLETEALQAPELGLDHLHQAAEVNPYSAAIQLQLAAAYRMAGNSPAELEATDHAVQLNPAGQATVWEAANTYLAEGEKAKALQQFRVIIAGDPQLRQSALNLTWRATRDADGILNGMLPPDSGTHLLLLNLMWHAGEAESAKKTWQRLVALHQPVEPHEAFGYMQYLIDQHDAEMARRVWTDLAELDPTMGGVVSNDGNLLSNAGFEQKLLNGGFGWRYWPTSGLDLSIDSTGFHSGTHALRLHLYGAPATGGIEQYFVVKPNTRYHFSGFVRTEEMESASAPRFAIIDGYEAGTVYLLTDEWAAGKDWYEQSGDFTTGSETRLLRLRVARQKNETQVRGTAWIDDLSVREQN